MPSYSSLWSAQNPGSWEWAWAAGLQKQPLLLPQDGMGLVQSPGWGSILWGPTSGEGTGSRASSAFFKSCSWGSCGLEAFPCHYLSAPRFGYVLILREEEKKSGRPLTVRLISQTCEHDLSINRQWKKIPAIKALVLLKQEAVPCHHVLLRETGSSCH